MVGIVEGIQDIITSSSKKYTEDCRSHPEKCLRQVVIDALVIIGLFAFLTSFVDHQTPSVDQIITFLTVWTPILFLLKTMDLENTEQFGRVAMWTLATKVFTILTATP